jgi:transposase
MDAQKKSMKASERDEAARALWRERGVNAWLWSRRRAWCLSMSAAPIPRLRRCMLMRPGAPRNERAVGSVPKNRGQNTTILGALNLEGVQAALTIEGAADGLVFEAFVEQVLCPTLQSGQIVVMDNLSTHKSIKVRALIESHGCQLWFLPTYSPDLNPIEMAWSKLKAYLRVVGARTREMLDEAIGHGLQTITPQDATNWFKHCYQLIW